MSEEIPYDPAYDDYTTDEYPPDWKARAKMVRERDGYMCQSCGMVGTRVDGVFFDVDHITPKSDGGSHARSNLQSLCPSCHAAKHSKNTNLAERARKWERRNNRSISWRILRVFLVVPILLDVFSRSRTITDRYGREIELTPIGSVSNMAAERGVSVDARVATLWDNSSEKIQQVGLLAPPVNSSPRDDTPVVKFVVWAGNDQPMLKEHGSYRIIGALTDKYKGKMQLKVDNQSEIQSL